MMRKRPLPNTLEEPDSYKPSLVVGINARLEALRLQRTYEIVIPNPLEAPAAVRWSKWFEHPSLQIEVSQIIIHKAHQPNVVVDFFDADGLAG